MLTNWPQPKLRSEGCIQLMPCQKWPVAIKLCIFQSRLNLNYTFPMWWQHSLCILATLSLLCLRGLSQHALTSPLCWVSYNLSVPSAVRTPCRQITTPSGAARSNALTLKVSSLWLFQVNKPPQRSEISCFSLNLSQTRQIHLCTVLTKV